MVKFSGKRFMLNGGIRRLKFIDFGVYETETGVVPGFMDIKENLVIVFNEKDFLKCITKFQDQAILKYSKNMEDFDNKFDSYAQIAGFNTLEILKMKNVARLYINSKSNKIASSNFEK